MFCLPARAKYPFFRLELMDYIGGWRNFVQSLSAFLLLFWWQKIAFNRPFELYFPSVYYWILLICIATIRNRGKDTHYVVVSRYAKLYQRFWIWNINQNLNMVLLIQKQSPEVFWKKGVPQNSQENTCTRVSFFNKVEETLAQVFSCEFCESFKNTFFYRTPPVAVSPNRGYLNCAILKALHAFQEKRDLKSRDMQFFLQNVSNEIFKINISNGDKNTNS